MSLSFEGHIEIRGVNPYVLVNADQARQIKAGWRKPMPLLVQINGQPDEPWRINMMPAGDGTFYLYLHESVRKASKTKVGDTVSVRIWFDEAYRSGPSTLPAWFRMALENDVTAYENWQKLSPSRQKEVVRYLDNLKSPEAQQRNLEKVMAMLGGTSGHFMGRDWQDGK